MGNYVRKGLEIKGERERVENVMDLLKGKSDEESRGWYIELKKIMGMGKELVIEGWSCGEFGMEYMIGEEGKGLN